KNHDVIRPTADRVRETIFNVVAQSCDGLSVLDLYAGTGALGLEAVSRGAVRAVLVDSGREAQALCRQNIEALGFGAVVSVLPVSVAAALKQLAGAGQHFELVFADPPYKVEAGAELVASVAAVLVDEGVFVLETSKHEVVPTEVDRLKLEDERRFGETVVRIFRLTTAVP
ncbi:MAG: 16S rRNA (guanine(966)-N(2))-methyltransferase RsmD, partial [Archangium sp.]|nr:16S rRNA (guanine(966)-N(2))-methyltransferase RsmD [Archangium sp.]